MMLLLGMLTGGLAYSRKLSVAQATREGARFGATLPITGALPVDPWLTRVANLTIASSDGELGATRPGQFVCVAYVASTGVARMRSETGGAVSFNDAACIADDGRTGETRVQVVARRSSKLEVLVFSQDLDLESHAVARFESS
jgi:Flp pilus assembly protein TadG